MQLLDEKARAHLDYVHKNYNKRFKRDKPNNITYKVDWNALKSLAFAKGYTSVGSFFSRKFGDRSMYEGHAPERMRWHRIGRVADALGVEPEVLIDEEFYFKRTEGMAAYKIVCRGYKKGLSPQDIIDKCCKNKNRKNYWAIRFLKCNFKAPISEIDLKTLHRFCNAVDMPVAALFRPFKNVTSSSIFGQIYSLVALLPEEDLAILAGTAKLLQSDYNDFVRREFNKLLKLRSKLKATKK